MSTAQKRTRSQRLTCLPCKVKKVKCDRAHPVCGRCQKGGGSSCKYPPGPPFGRASSYKDWNLERSIAPDETPLVATQTPLSVRVEPEKLSSAPTTDNGITVDRSAEKFRELEEKFIHLESLMKRPRDSMGEPESSIVNSSLTDQNDASLGGAPSAKRQTKMETSVKGLFVGKGFKTKYYGASYAVSLLSEFPELSQYSTEIDQKFSFLKRIRDPLKTAKLNIPKRPTQAKVDTKTLVSLLPDRSVTDKLVTCYLDGLETIFHVLHAPSFWAEYNHFWTSPSDEPDIAFAVLLFLIMAAVCSVPELEKMTYAGQSSASRNTAVEWIELGESWIKEHSQKHVTLRYLQTRCLLVIAQRMNEYKPKRAWAASGDLLRYAISAGYHREPTLLKKKTSVFDQEMRRRLWATIVELDLRACLERGMLPTLRVGQWDCYPPLNILDSDLESCLTSNQLPASRPSSFFTSCSFLRATQESLTLRLELLSLINQLSGNPTQSQVISYDERLVQTLDELPVWADSNSETTQPSSPHALAQTLLRTQLLAFRLLIHRQSTLSHAPYNRSHYSRTVCLDCASQILIQYEQLQNSEETAYYSLLLYTDDVFRAALSICFDLVQTQGGLHYTGGSQDGGIFIKQVDTSLAMLESKALRLGRGIPQFGTMSIARSLAHSQLSHNSSTPSDEDAANGIAALHHKIISSQERPVWPRETLNGNGIADSLYYSDQPGKTQAAGQLPTADQASFNSLAMVIEDESLDSFGWTLGGFWEIS